MIKIIRLEDSYVFAQNGELGALLRYLNAVTELDQVLGTTLQTWNVAIEAHRGDQPTISP